MDQPVAGFDWDDGNREKCRQHGVLIADIEVLFRQEIWVIPDPSHSASETRFRAIGIDAKGRHLFVAFTLRNRQGMRLVRPISARYMHKKEVRHYEKQKAETEKTSGSENG